MSRRSSRDNGSIDDIFDESDSQVRESNETIVEIPKQSLYSIKQVRTKFSGIDELRMTIEEQGQRSPVRVGAQDAKGFVIQEGERRWRAIMLSDKITHVKCIIGKGNLVTQLIENIQREQLNPVDEGNGYLALKEEHNWENKQVAEAVRVSESRVSAAINAALSPEIIIKAFDEDKIGDVDTINSLRIAHKINPESVQSLLDSSDSVSRNEAKELTKTLKAGKGKTDKKTLKQNGKNSRTKVTGVRVNIDGKLGTIDLSGHAEEGHIVVVLDNSTDKVTVPVSKVTLVGYAS
ncbi:chromosome partitioning protein ParB [Vibrio sp. MACH09]|uniref:ParB/RepB/Spo0J family partition protein n=1 Tax=Vibrio sp. MACH09 TaxID=3025122 RepID=UPI002791BB4E|nr:ParB/RepB/Spo0J family partition protein [Vibrio sp. MACH09]GLO64152.1 chromosome partitioning protein ParB [Vibrio sp. MACH09]